MVLVHPQSRMSQNIDFLDGLREDIHQQGFYLRYQSQVVQYCEESQLRPKQISI